MAPAPSIPPGYIFLEDAFGEACRVLEPEYEALGTREIPWEPHSDHQSDGTAEAREIPGGHPNRNSDGTAEALEGAYEPHSDHQSVCLDSDRAAYDSARCRVQRRMRDALADGSIAGWVRDPRTGSMTQLGDREKWRVMGLVGVGLQSVPDAMNPGPDTDGAAAALENAEFADWLRRVQTELGIATVEDRTGAPGRPSKGAHLISDEFDRRSELGDLEAGVTEQARVLLQWLKETHPLRERPTVRTIENQIRDRYRRAKAKRTK